MKEISRRSFLFLTGGTGAAMTVEPGRQVLNRLIPWVIPPENILPGEWTFFATTCRECPAGCGMHLWHRDGRVTKAEGNPDHPVNRGGLCARGQASLQGLYDPDRVQKVYHSGQPELPGPLGWATAIAALAPALKAGKGRITLISDLQTGTLAEVMRSFARTFASPDRLLLFEAFNYQPLRTAHQKLFGRGIVPEYRLQQCDFIISFGADFLETWISPVGFASQFAGMHAYRDGKMGKLAYVGARKSMTAGSADDFVQVPPGKERWVALAMLQEMSDQGWVSKHRQEIESALENLGGKKAAALSGVPHDKLQRLARDFAQADASVALAGPVAGRGPVAIDTAVAAGLLNAAAGRLGQTVDFTRPHALGDTATEEALEQLLKGVTAEDVIIIHHANLAYARPHLVEKLRRAGTLVYLTDLPDETAEIADWVLPIDTFLETWGDYEPYAGNHSLLQPTMARLYDSRGAGDFLIALANAAGRPLSRPDGEAAPVDFTDWLRQRWRELLHRQGSGGSPEEAWRQALQRGGLWTQAPGEQVGLQATADLRFAPAGEPPETPDQADLWLWPSIYLFDGRLANRAWLQEMPHPVSTIVWGSWLDIHPNKAKRLNLKEGDVVDVTTPAGTVAVPVRITEEVTAKTVALALGQGRSASRLSVARGVGVNAFLLLGGEAPAGVFPRVSLHPSGRREPPVYLSATRDQYHRDFLKTVPLDHLRQMTMAEAEEIILPLPEGYAPGRDLYAPHQHKGHRWGMVVDLQKCIGCHACAVACYAENNIPVMGRVQDGRGLEMAWLKVPPYRLEHHPDKIAWLPLPCQQCDAAPCEPVCPVFAAMHTEEGLNAQVYNRCVGTRYCSNNCPYKVRRFNWFNVEWKEPLPLQLNPEVTVRARGVMEKCTFCVQRIRKAEYQARIEDRPVRDGEIQPACVQSCPTRVFTFGDLLDHESAVWRLIHEDPRRYQVLKDLNTKPAVFYLKKVVVEEKKKESG